MTQAELDDLKSIVHRICPARPRAGVAPACLRGDLGQAEHCSVHSLLKPESQRLLGFVRGRVEDLRAEEFDATCYQPKEDIDGVQPAD